MLVLECVGLTIQVLINRYLLGCFFFGHIVVSLVIIIALWISLLIYFVKAAKTLQGLIALMRKQIRLLLFVIHVVISITLLLSYKIYGDLKKNIILNSIKNFQACLLSGSGTFYTCPPPILLNFGVLVSVIFTFASVGAVVALIMGFSYRTVLWYNRMFKKLLILILGDKANTFALSQINPSDPSGSDTGTGDTTISGTGDTTICGSNSHSQT